MNSTQLPTWEELNEKHKKALDRCMVYAFGSEDKKNAAMTELWDVSVQLKGGAFR